MRCEQLHQRGVHLGRTGDDVSALRVLVAGERAAAAPRLLDEKRTRGRIPGAQADFPERVYASGGDVSQVERGGAGAAHTRRVLGDRLEHAEVRIEVARIGTVGEASGDQRALDGARLADTHAVIVEMRAGAAAGGEQLLAHRVVDDRVLEAASDLAGDRHGEHREAVQEVGGTIERVDDPERIVRAARAAFLGEECMLRIVAADGGDDFLLGRVVHLGDEVVAPLGSNGQRLQAVQAADDDLAGTARGAHGDVEKRRHGP
jgi:hypothetical protein